MSVRDTLVQLGFVMMAVGASYATWALLTGPLARFTKPRGTTGGTRSAKPPKPAGRRAPKT